MDLSKILGIIQIIICTALIISVILQQQGASMGAMFGGATSESYVTRRGGEKALFNLTIALSVFFAANSIILAILNARS